MTLFEQYKIAIDLLEKESDRFWARNNVLLLVQAAYISFYVAASKNNLFFSLIFAIQGIIIGIVWIGILRKGTRYVTRWDECVRELESMIISTGTREFVGLKSLNDKSKVKEKKLIFPLKLIDKRTTTLIRYLIISICIFWLIVLLVSLYGLLFLTERKEIQNIFFLV